MSLWRAKKRYDAHQDLNEVADNTLLAISLLRNNPDTLKDYPEERIVDHLEAGTDLLRDIHESIDSPEEVEEYHVFLADHLRSTGQKQTPEQFTQELTAAVQALEETSNSLEFRTELNDVERLFRRIEEFTSKASTRNLEDVKNNFAVRNR